MDEVANIVSQIPAVKTDIGRPSIVEFQPVGAYAVLVQQRRLVSGHEFVDDNRATRTQRCKQHQQRKTEPKWSFQKHNNSTPYLLEDDHRDGGRGHDIQRGAGSSDGHHAFSVVD